MKVITLTFSPCIDKTTSVADLIPEKKLRCSEPVLDAGGGGINVARALKKLGLEATAIYPSGGCTGQLFDQLLERDQVRCINISTNSETRENFIVVEEATGKQYRFGTPGTLLTEEEWKSCVDAVRQADGAEYIVASGSLPPGVPNNIFATIAAIAKEKKARFIVDTSGEALKDAVAQGVFLLKPNLNELGALSGMPVAGTAQIIDAAKLVIEQNNCEVIVVSMGAAGALMITKDEAEKIPAPRITMRSTVGAGDSMLAGIVLSLTSNASLLEAVRYGVACGSAATMNPGTELCKKQDADRLYAQILELSAQHV
jgi:6-phosphofructokinase 2